MSLLLILAIGPGCVYLRFNKLMGQLADFPDYFEIDNRPRPHLVFKDPILKAKDISWLFGLEPSSRMEAGDSEREEYVFEKRAPGEKPGHPGDRLVFTIIEQQGRMQEFAFPEHFAPFMTQTNFMEVFLPIRDALIHRGDRQAEWTWANMNIRIPDRATILHYLGTPTASGEDAGIGWFLYHYDQVAQTGSGSSDPDRAPALRVFFSFWPQKDRLMLADITAGRLWVESNLASEDKMIKLQRK